METRTWVVLLGIVVIGVGMEAAADHPDPLPDVITTPNFDYHINFTNNNSYTPPAAAGDDLHYMPTSQAQDMADALDNNDAASQGNPSGYHAGYSDLGFQDPDFDGSDSDVMVFNCGAHGGCDSGNAPRDRINMPATSYIQSAESCLRLVLGHELFHHTQYSYITFDKWLAWGREAVEGTARVMQDKVYSDLDGDAGCITYLGQVNNYLGSTNRDMWGLSYTTALFWNYMMEQLGSAAAEPQVGTDFVRKFWENAQANNASPDLVATIRQTIQQFDVGASLENVFHDFTIANYAKDLDVTPLTDGSKYRYEDESDGVSAQYNSVATAWSGTVPPQRGPAASSVVRWGARYFEANIGDCGVRDVLGFRAEGDRAAYSLIAVSEGNKASRVYKGVTDDFAKALVQRGGSERITGLVGIAAGLDDPADFDYTFDCGAAKLTIKLPDASNQAYVGTHDAPDPFLARVLVTGPTSLGDPTVEGLDPDDFTVYVGPVDPANQAPVISAARVQGEYWITAQAPGKPANGSFDLVVKLGDSIMDSRDQAVIYEKLVLDQVLVIDRSGSMGSPTASPKMEAAKNAASLFVDAARSDDKIGVVSFSGDNVEPNNDANVDAILADATNAHRDLAKNRILTLSDGGLTSIGDGLAEGADEIALRGGPIGEDWLVLLSDGMENEALYWSNIKAAIQADDIKVHTIALGPDTDQALLQTIASDTGGNYYYVDVGTVAPSPAFSPSSSPAPAAPAPTLPNQLADIYAAASETIQRHERIREFSGALDEGDSRVHEILIQEGGISEAIFSVNWDDANESLEVAVVRPDGSTVMDGVGGAQIFKDESHMVVRVPTLEDGRWNVVLQANRGSPNYVGNLSGRNMQGARMQLYFGQFHGDDRARAQNGLFLRGLPQPILATLFDRKGPIGGAAVLATIEHPDGSLLRQPLWDDGNHGDGKANDGIYGNDYTRTTAYSVSGLPDKPGNGQRGSYKVVAEATGNDNLRGSFTRVKKGAFQVFELFEPDPDTDKDTMPSRYEDLHACLDSGNYDAEKDPDNDRLTNREEWEIGTDPCHPDTDRGGEVDLSELRRDANPFDPRDDALPRPIHVEVVDWVSDHMPFPKSLGLKAGANLLRFPPNSAYAMVRILRSEFPDGPFPVIAEFDPAETGGFYMDDALTVGRTYYYMVQPVDRDGNEGVPSPVFSGTPNSDPAPSVGSVLINGGAEHTESLVVNLGLGVDDADVVRTMLANEPTFSGRPWQAYAPSASWTLAPKSTSVATVYAKYQDAAGNVSSIYQDDINVVPAGSLGAAEGTLVRPDALRVEGAQVKSTDHPGVLPRYSDSSGYFKLADLLPGDYDLLIRADGFHPKSLESVLVKAGGTAVLGAVILDPIDTDEDGEPDVTDNCTLVPNGVNQDKQRNTDGDAYGNRCDGDFNNDEIVNALDLGYFRRNFGSKDPDADLNGDGFVNALDLGAFRRMFGRPPGPSGLLD